MSKAIETKLFLGLIQNNELKMHLAQSQEWEKAKIFTENQLKEIHWHDKDYIGALLSSPANYAALQKKAREVKSQLQLYCPKFKVDNLIFYIFPQVFIR